MSFSTLHKHVWKLTSRKLWSLSFFYPFAELTIVGISWLRKIKKENATLLHNFYHIFSTVSTIFFLPSGKCNLSPSETISILVQCATHFLLSLLSHKFILYEFLCGEKASPEGNAKMHIFICTLRCIKVNLSVWMCAFVDIFNNF